MPRNKVKRWWRPIKKTPRPVKKTPKFGRAIYTPAKEISKPATPMLRYIEENQASGLSRKELVEQFHEYDCDGELVEGVGVAACTKCDYWETRRHDNNGEITDVEEE